MPSLYTYEPPGVPSNPADTNFADNGDGTFDMYPPDEPAPDEATTYSTPDEGSVPPDEPTRTDAVIRGLMAGGPYGGLVPPTYLPPGERAGPAAGPGAETFEQRMDRQVQAYLRAMEAADAADREYNRGESARRFGVTEARLSAADRATAAANREHAAAVRDQAAATREAASQRLQAELRQAAQNTTDQDRRSKLALATALLGMGTGPNGPANRRMALELLSGLGINIGGGGAGGGTTQSPNLIPPALWDALPPGAKTLLMDAWQAQGGDPRDFQFAINQQRPQGEASTPRVRYAAPVGA